MTNVPPKPPSTIPSSPPHPCVAADLVEDFAADIEQQVELLEDVADDLTRHVERTNEVAATMVLLITSMRREAERARTAR
jgi:hypothetical protein